MNPTALARRSRAFLVGALAVLGGVLVLGLAARLVPSADVQRIALLVLPLLVPVAVVLAIVAIVLAVVALVRGHRDPGSERATAADRARDGQGVARGGRGPAVVALVGSVALLVLLPVLVLAGQLLLVAVGDLVN